MDLGDHAMDTAVSSAAAEDPGEAVGNFCDVAVRISVQKGFGGDGEPWGAEPALRSMQGGDSLCKWVRLLHIAQSFHRDQVLANDSNKREKAGVDCYMLQFSRVPLVNALEYNCASTTASLTASQFCPFAPVLRSDEIQQRPFWIWVL